MAKTNFLEDRILDLVLRNNADFAYTFPTSVYVALFTADPGEAGAQINEVSGGAYARQLVAFSTIVADSGQALNSGVITFPTATASWGTVTHVGIMDALTTGNMLYYGALGTSKTVGLGDQLSFAISTLTVTEG